jgi:ion channel-forming bestrophin family protein
LNSIAARQYKWTFEFGRQLRNGASTPDEYGNDAEVLKARQYHNPALFLLQKQSAELRQLFHQQQLDRLSFLEIDKTLLRLCASQGMAERIKSTIFPSTYRMYLHSMIYLFVISLSIALKEVHWFFELPLLLSLASAFFLLERSARDLQDPFEGTPSDIPVTAIALKIRQNIQELLDEPTPDIAPTTSFYEL